LIIGTTIEKTCRVKAGNGILNNGRWIIIYIGFIMLKNKFRIPVRNKFIPITEYYEATIVFLATFAASAISSVAKLL
jgi:hypothetical protein